jgi:hypothetical protein
MPPFLRRYVERTKFTLLALVAVILPVTVSITAASYCVSIFDIGGTLSKAIELICFFAVLIAEALAYDKFQRWRIAGKSHEPEFATRSASVGRDGPANHDVRNGSQ